MSSYTSVTHVIFDLDGLLLDTESLYKSKYAELLKKFGHDYTDELRLKVLGTKEQDTSRIIVNELKLPISDEEFTKQSKEMLQTVLDQSELMPGAERLVRHLHMSGVTMAVATSSGKESVELKLKNHKDLFALFHHIVMGSSDPEVVNGKPSPDIFLIAAKRFDSPVEPSKCLVFEDAVNGVLAAKSAGMQVVMVPDDTVPEDKRKLATLCLNSLEEFRPALFGLPEYP